MTLGTGQRLQAAKAAGHATPERRAALVDCADEMLYTAKESGRNQVSVYR